MNLDRSALLEGTSTGATLAIGIDPRLYTARPWVSASQGWTFIVTVKVIMLKNFVNMCPN